MKFNEWRKAQIASGKTMGVEVVSTVFLDESPMLPFVYRSNVQDLDLSKWYKKNEQQVQASLDSYGAILFRGFRVHNQSDFEDFVKVAMKKTAKYVEGATPRTHLNDGIYTATEFPADQEIAPHNELSYVLNPPDKLLFCCLKAPAEGGQTHIVDVSKVYQRIDSKIIEEFERRNGWMLRRNYGNGFGPTLDKAFGMSNVEDIRVYGEKTDLKVTVLSDTTVSTEQIRDAVHLHPRSGEKVWFNHIAFWHPTSLCPKVMEAMASSFTTSEFPYCTYYGDGTDIDDQTVEAIRHAYSQEEVKFNWQEGDVMLLDNWKVAHGRKPFNGTRQLLVAMG